MSVAVSGRRTGGHTVLPFRGEKMRLKMTIFALLLAAFARPASAQVNLQVSPYPVPYPFFEAGSENSIFSLSYVHSSLSQTNQPNLTLDGTAIGIAYRKAMDDKMAWDAQLSIVPEVGQTTYGARLYSVGVPLTTDFEYQAYRSKSVGVIVFAGPHFNIGSSNYAQPAQYASTAVVPDGKGVNTSGSTSLMYGLQFGGEVGLDAGGAKFAPFLMFSPNWGTYTTEAYGVVGGQGTLVKTSHSLPTIMTTSLGLQVFFGQGFGISLVSQSAPSATANGITYSSFNNLLVNFNFAF
jgi:hypothetical protein